MFPTRIVRPDLRQPDTLHALMSTDMLHWLELGLLEKCKHLHQEIKMHDSCDMFREDGCKVREKWMIDSYGSVKEAIDNGCRVSDCSEDLSFRYKALAELMDFITQSRYMRSTADSRSLREIDDATAQFLAIKGQMAHRAAQATVPTGTMDKLTPERLAELDKEFGEETKDKTLLGLTVPADPANAAPSDNAKPSAGKMKVVK